MVGTIFLYIFPLVKFVLFTPLHFGIFNHTFNMMVLGENGHGNRVNSDPKLTGNNGNQKNTRIVSPNSDMVGEVPHMTKIKPSKSRQNEHFVMK